MKVLHSNWTEIPGPRQRNLLENTIIVLVSDHGEEFLDETGQFTHGTFHGNVVKTAFVILDPKLKKRIDYTDYSQSFDIAPTLYSYLGKSIPNDTFGLPLLEENGRINKSNIRDFVFGLEVNRSGFAKKGYFQTKDFKLHEEFGKTQLHPVKNFKSLDGIDVSKENPEMVDQLSTRLNSYRTASPF